MKKQLLVIYLILFSFRTFYAQGTGNNLDAQQTLSKSDKHFFIENKGQWPSEVLFLAQLGGLNTWITKNGMLYEFYKTEEINPSEIDEKTSPLVDKFEQKDYKRWGHRVAYSLIGNNTEVNTQGKQKQSGYYNYLIGNDPSKHASYVGLYKDAVVKQVYEGIDMRYYFDKGSLRYDYFVHPGADPSQIKFKLDGSDKNYLNEHGELVLTTCFGEVKNVELYCYQQQDKKQVSAKFIENGNSFSFTLGSYNKNETLIIDPLIYSTFVGGSNDDVCRSSTIDANNSVFITGYSSSIDYDTTMGAYQTSFSGNRDVFVSKINSSGSGLVFSTYIGGSDIDDGQAIALDNLGNSYITGYTKSTDFPISINSPQTIQAGNYDAFITKLDSSGAALIFSSYFGGAGIDYAYSIAVDSVGNSIITGSTTSFNLFTTPGAFQLTNNGLVDAFICKINSIGSTILHATYLGGSADDIAYSITIDGAGLVYVTGETKSNNFDVTPGAFQTTLGGDRDVFITKFNLGNSIEYSTYLGGFVNDVGFSITVDSLNNAYVTGRTNSPDFDKTPNAIQWVLNGFYDIFVTKINDSGSSLVYSTLFGGGGIDEGYSIKIDDSLNAYIAGTTTSSNYYTTPGAFQETYNGGLDDAFIFKLNSTCTTLLYSTYIGGINVDIGISLNIDASKIVYIAGITKSIDLAITSGAYQQTISSTSYETFVSKICLSGVKLISPTNTINQTICINAPLTTINYSVVGSYFSTNVVFSGLPSGIFGTWTPNNITISGIPTVAGTFNYSINASLDCGGTVIKNGTITVYPAISVFSASLSPTLCLNTLLPTITHKITGPYIVISNVLGLPAGVSPLLGIDSLYINGSPTSNGLYNYTITLGGCGPNVFATGTIIVNTCTAIEDYSANYFFSISPNPSEGIYQIIFEKGISSDGLFELYDMQGRLILNESIGAENTQQLDLTNQPNGMYVLKVKAGNLEEVVKLVKM